jgi:hypothetical protein
MRLGWRSVANTSSRSLGADSAPPAAVAELSDDPTPPSRRLFAEDVLPLAGKRASFEPGG